MRRKIILSINLVINLIFGILYFLLGVHPADGQEAVDLKGIHEVHE